MGDGDSHFHGGTWCFLAWEVPHIPGPLVFVSYDGPGEGEGSGYPICANEENRAQEAWVTCPEVAVCINGKATQLCIQCLAVF